MNNIEWVDGTHDACSGQGCRNCSYTGIDTFRINHSEVAA